MSTFTSLALVLWGCAIVTAQSPVAVVPDKLAPVLQLKTGNSFVFEFEAKHQSQSTGEISYRAEAVQKGTLQFQVKEVAPNGLASLRFRLTRYVMKSHFETVGGTEQNHAFNSEDPADVERVRRNADSAGLIQLINADFKLDIKPSGGMIAYEAPAPSKTSEWAGEAAEAIAEIVRDLFAPLPGQVVGTGDVWQYTLAEQNSRIGKLKIEYTCRLKSNDEGQALIGVVGRVREASPDEESEVRITPKNFTLWQDLEFSLKRGMPTGYTFVEEFEFDVTQNGKHSRMYGSDVHSVKSN